MLLGNFPTLHPETLPLLQTVFEKCRRKLHDAYGRGDRSQLRMKEELVAARIRSHAKQGVRDSDELEKHALCRASARVSWIIWRAAGAARCVPVDALFDRVHFMQLRRPHEHGSMYRDLSAASLGRFALSLGSFAYLMYNNHRLACSRNED
jgi:hypothetical protein